MQYNKGTLLKLPIKDFINKKLDQKMKKKSIKIKKIKYTIIKELGQGGCGRVYQVLSKSDNKYYAIKEIPIKEEKKRQLKV